MRSLHGITAAVERLVKGALFDCKLCGQCILSDTAFLCPMACPKGLRNGPCGGTTDGRCEVRPEMPCVWTAILDRTARGPDAVPRLHAPLDPGLLGTSSWWNLATGADCATRRPVALAAAPVPRACPPRTASHLERALCSGFAFTSEVRSPRSEDALSRVLSEVKVLATFADAINATSSHGGLDSIPSRRTLEVLAAADVDGILQVCGRDADPRSFLDELVEADRAGVRNVLCLTGDWSPAARPDLFGPEGAWKSYFPMDSSQMLLEMSTLAREGRSAFSDLAGRPAPRLFAGAAINPFSMPREAVLARLAQKIACGAAFIQTQIVLAAAPFNGFMELAVRAGLRDRVYVLATVPVVGSPRALEVLSRLPGVVVPATVRRRLEEARDLALEGQRVAREVMEEVQAAGLVDGFHLVNFGSAPDAIAELALDFLEAKRLRRASPEPAES